MKDEKKGFEWLRRACEPAAAASGGKRRGSAGGEGGGMGGGGTEPAALAPEMVVAILEVAQCFLHGWGCAKVSSLLIALQKEKREKERNERADSTRLSFHFAACLYRIPKRQ